MPSETPKQEASSQNQAPEPAEQTRGVALIVDDNPAIRTLLSARVRTEGFSAMAAENGLKALSILREQNVDVVLADISMPELDGIGLLEAIVGDAKLQHIPVLMISSGDDQAQIIRCIEKGAVDYLVKPFNQGILKARLTTCIARKQQRDRELYMLRQAQAASQPQQQQQAAPATDASDVPEAERTHVMPADEIVITGVVRPEPARQLHNESSDTFRPDAVKLLDHVGNIKLIKFIGKGAMGDVYLGHHDLLNMDMAVKLIRGDWLNNLEARKRFVQEARVAARLSHPNIVRLHELGQSVLGVYLAFEFVHGGTLRQKLEHAPGNRLAIPEAIRITIGICQALTEAHRMKIVHRDLKPANILLTSEGEPKVADLGLAKQLSNDRPSDITGVYVPIGTPAYMAPEQIQSDQPIDTRADLYAVGVMLFQMLAGRVPFADKSAHDAMLAQLHRTPPPVESFNPDVPQWLRGLVSSLLEKSPGDRPLDAAQVIQVLTQETRSAQTT